MLLINNILGKTWKIVMKIVDLNGVKGAKIENRVVIVGKIEIII
jgi:nicotinic acid phosphoribosyltransferase